MVDRGLAVRLAAAAVFAATTAEAGATRFVGFAWEFSRMSITNLVGYVDELDKTPLDGIGVYLNEGPEDARVSTHNIMTAAWRRDVLEPLVDVARALTAHRSMRESFVGTFRSPTARRVEWGDDAGWARIATNMTIAAWFAKAGGFRGLSMDPEDYRHVDQFTRRAGDAPYADLCALARRRGREVFKGVFREYPDVRILSFWFLSLNPAYFGSDDPARDARERGDLWPAFADGILDVMPAAARIVDGDEHAYRYEADRGEFWRAACAMRLRLPLLVSPENREKYRRQVGVSFGQYLDMFTNPEGASWYFGPVDGSRLRHFERNLFQAAEAADEYVWFWGERRCWADWKGGGPNDERKISSGTWEEALPGLEDAILAVKRPFEFAKRRGTALKAAGRFAPLNENPSCDSADGAVPAPYSAWQRKTVRQGRLFADAGALCAEGVEDGAFTLGFSWDMKPGDRFLVRVSAKGDGGTAIVCWKRGEKFDWDVLSPVQIGFSPPDDEGWRRGHVVARVPETADGASLVMMVRQQTGQSCRFDDVEIYDLGM